MNTNLPPSIQRQVEEAEALERQLLGQADTVQTGQPSELAPPEVTLEPQAQPGPEPVVPHADWEQRFNTLRGKYDAEIPRLHEQLRERDSTLRSLELRLQELETKPAAEAKPEPLVTSADEDAFGSDLVDLARRVAKAEITAALAAFEAKFSSISETVGAVAKTQATTAQERFWHDLSQLVPDWQAVNKDQRWLTWLGEIDPFAGAARQEALNTASGNLDAKRVAAIFDAWRSSTPSATPVPSLERQIAPSKGKAASAPTGDRIWSLAEYEAAFDPRGRFARPQAEIEALQADADRALAEGRVR